MDSELVCQQTLSFLSFSLFSSNAEMTGASLGTDPDKGNIHIFFFYIFCMKTCF